MPPRLSRARVAVALVLLNGAAAQVDTHTQVCGPSKYSYYFPVPSSGVCASCAAGATFVSESAGCTRGGTAFYLSGSMSEGVAAFTLGGVALGFVADQRGAKTSALNLISARLTAAGGSVLPQLPAGGADFSAAAWVQCAEPANSAGFAAALEWGSAGDAGAGASPQALALVVGGTAPAPDSGNVSTLVGSGFGTFADGAGSFNLLKGVAVIPSTGVIVVAESLGRIRLVTPLAVVTVLAGSGNSAYADGLGQAASFSSPYGVAVIPSSGLIVVADSTNHRIRLVTPLGVVTTLAGSGASAFADGSGAAASFSSPYGVAVNPSSGVIVVADTQNHRIRLVTPLGFATTLAGSGYTDQSGHGDYADGTGTAASFNSPEGVAVVPSSGVIVVADTENNRIRLVTPGGGVTTLAGSGNLAHADSTGTAASFATPCGVAVIPSSGMIVVIDNGGYARIRLVTPLGVVTTLAGGSGFFDGTGTAAGFYGLVGVAVSPTSGAIVVADNGSRLRLVTYPAVLPACDSTWHHAALVYSPSATPYSLSAFVDGALVFAQAAAVTLPPASSSTLRIGWSGDLNTNGGSLFVGLLSDMRIYSRALSAWDIAGLASCVANTYSYGGGCASCAANATFLSASAGCSPPTQPTDTAFYLSGSAAEGVAAFLLVTGAAPTFVADHLGAAAGALALGLGGIYDNSEWSGARAPALCGAPCIYINPRL